MAVGRAGNVVVTRCNAVHALSRPEAIDTGSETILVDGRDLLTLGVAQRVAIRGCDQQFADLLSLIDTKTLACLLADSVVAPETLLVVPWNGAIDGRLQIIAVDADTVFTIPKRIGMDTAIKVAVAHHERRQATDRNQWYAAVVAEYPGQDDAVGELLDLSWDHFDQFESAGVIVSGSDADHFVQVFARRSGLPLHTISVSELFSAKRGQAERRLQAAFQDAFATAPAMIALHDLGLLQNSAQGERLRFCLEQLLDDLQHHDEVFVVLAPIEGPASALPASLRRSLRLDRTLHLRSLDSSGRCAILRSLIGDRFNLDQVVAKAHGFSRGDLQQMCTEAALIAIDRGDSLCDAHFLAALDRVRPSSLDERVRATRPARSLSNMAGIDSIVARLRAAIMTPLRSPESYQRLGIRVPRGVLLFGPSGVGKTTLALGIAAEANAVALEARGCDLISAVVGDSERAIRDLFQHARALAPAVIVLDQVEMLAPRRNRDHSRTYDRVLSCLLTELDGVTSRAVSAPLVFVIGTTSFRERMDDAILRPGRFDEQIEVGLPEQEARIAILRECCRAMPLNGDVDLEDIARRTVGYSGADLQGVCNETAMNVLRRDMDAGIVTARDFHLINSDR